MESFTKFLENENMQSTTGNGELPSANQIKDKNMSNANRILKQNPEILLGQLMKFDMDNPGQISDIINFAKRHDFDDTMPLHSLLAVYGRFAK